MKKIILFICCIICTVCNAIAETDYVPGHLIIGIKKEVAHQSPAKGSIAMGIESIDMLNAQYGCKNIRTIMSAKKSHGAIYLLVFAETADIQQLQKAYMATGLVRYAEPDYIAKLEGAIPNDTLFSRQWSLHNDGSFTLSSATAGADIDMLRAWDVEEGDTTVIMAIIDSGLKMDHPEFDNRLWINHKEIPGNGIDDDNNGYIDDIHGWNVVTDTNYLADDNGHGTNVAGIIAANGNNTAGYSGIDKHCKVMICKAANAAGSVEYSAIAETISYAVDNGAQIINISAGGYWGSSSFTDVVQYAYDHDVTIVAAMGNQHTSTPLYPAACKHVIAVGATGPTDEAASFSSFGNHISVVAPGEYIYGPSHLYDTAYGVWYYGTSQAAPHVAGVAALLLAQNNTRKPDDIRMLIETNAEDLVGDKLDEPGWDKYYGYGRLNAYRALTNEALTIKEERRHSPFAGSIYPNPAARTIHFNIPDAGNVYITNVTGSIIWQNLLAQGMQQVTLPAAADGIYQLHYTHNDKHWVERFSIIKN